METTDRSMNALREGRKKYWEQVRLGQRLSSSQIRAKRLREEAETSKAEKIADQTEANIMRVMCAELTGYTLLSQAEIVAGSQDAPVLCGVYFLVEGKEVVYVGQSINVMARIATHRADKRFSRFAYIPCKPEILDRLESLYIHTLRPALNGDHCVTGTKLAPLNLRDLLGAETIKPSGRVSR